MKRHAYFSGFFLTAFFVSGIISPQVARAVSPVRIELSSSEHFVVLSKAGVTTTGTTSIVGDVGVSPIAATSITGFSLNLPVGSVFATSPLVTGNVYAPGYANPTPTNMTTAIQDFETSYADGAGRTNPTATELGSGNIGGLTIAPGLYKWSSDVMIPTNVTLSGSANDVWIFQIAQNLTVSPAVQIILSGGAHARNIFWVVAGQTTIGTTAVFEGTILDQTAIILNTGAVLHGRAFAKTAVTLDANIIVISSGVPAVVSPIQVVVPVLPVLSPVTPTIVVPTTISIPVVSPLVVLTTPTIPVSVVSTTVIPVVPAPSVVVKTIDVVASVPAKVSAPVVDATSLSTELSATLIDNGVRSIAKSFIVGSCDREIITLQKFLTTQNKGPAARNLALVTPTTYFGTLTRAALAEFQASVGIRPASGSFGPITRAYIRSH